MLKKILAVAGCAVLAIGLWLYVVLVIGPEYTETFRNVEVKLVGELKSDLMILGEQKYTIDLELSGNRSDLNKINSSNILVELDLSKIQKEGKSAYRYEVQLPNTVTIENREPAGITLDVVSRKVDTFDIRFDYDEGKIPQGYGVLEVEAEMKRLEIAGPEEIINQIAVAVVDIEITDQNNKTDIEGEYEKITYLDAQGKKVDATNITRLTPGSETIEAKLPIRVKKEIPLGLYMNEGGGITSENVSIVPKTISVLGTEESLEGLEVWYLNSPNAPVELSQVTEETTLTFPITLSEDLVNKNGHEEAVVSVSFEGLKETSVTFKTENIEILNLPTGVFPDITQEQIKIRVRGPEKIIDLLTDENAKENFQVSVDFTGAKPDAVDKDWPLKIKILNHPEVGLIVDPEKPYTIFVEMLTKEEWVQLKAEEDAQRQATETIITLLRVGEQEI